MLAKANDSGVIYAMKALSKAQLVEKNEVVHTKTERRALSDTHHPFLVHLRFAFQVELSRAQRRTRTAPHAHGAACARRRMRTGARACRTAPHPTQRRMHTQLLWRGGGLADRWLVDAADRWLVDAAQLVWATRGSGRVRSSLLMGCGCS